MTNIPLHMTPPPGERFVRFVGDVLTFQLETAGEARPEAGVRALLRTTIGRGRQLRQEIQQAHFRNLPPAGAAWRDIPMTWQDGRWSVTLPLAEVGFFQAKAYLIDSRGWQTWPEGPDFGVNVQPDWCRTGNIIYCAFPRMFGPSRSCVRTEDAAQEKEWRKLDAQGFTLIPPSGKLRDLIAALPHIFDTLGCRLLHLLPVGPTPTTMAKFGRFGSPYAVQDLTAIDPALVEFDHRTTGVEQFRELTDAVHLRNGRVMLDLVINHTGWGSTLFEEHPEWFVKDATGQFVSPGAWGTVWEDLVEIDPTSAALWDELAEVFLTWCRRGVDGFRCDAGYKVPVLVWQYITARVHHEFPETVFLLEGLGGGWDDTAIRLTEGGMQWAYSEIFQNYTPAELCGYLDHAWRQSRRVGLLIHYSETHDNDRLAARGRKWALLRNQLCALTSVSGGFGFTNGVEWLAPEKVNVHSARGLAWGSEPNLLRELGDLNRLLTHHPCFFDGARLIQVSGAADPVLVFARVSSDGAARVLILSNLDLEKERTFRWSRQAIPDDSDGDDLLPLWAELAKTVPIDRLTGAGCPSRSTETGRLEWVLPAGATWCLQCVPAAGSPEKGDDYRHARARIAFAFLAAHAVNRELEVAGTDRRQLDREVDEDPARYLSRLLVPPGETLRAVIEWTELDQRRVTPVPPGHWLLVKLEGRFRLKLRGADGRQTVRLSAVPAGRHWVAAVPPGQRPGEAQLEIERYQAELEHLEGAVLFLEPVPSWSGVLQENEPLGGTASDRTVLLTNGRGGMARVNLDLGRVRSKYDCLLGANLHPELPVDRHVLIKRIRIWANADGFISPLNADNLLRFELGPPAVWRFRVPAGDGRAVFVRVAMEMIENRNTVVIELRRETLEAAETVRLRLTVRCDLEDRNFHGETRRNGGAEHHFTGHTRPLTDRAGFVFSPAVDRAVWIAADAGSYHVAPEWSEHLAHPVEASRGQTGEGDGWSPGWFDLPLEGAGAVVHLTASTEPLPGVTEWAGSPTPTVPDPAGRTFEQQLHAAAAQFIVRRGEFKSMIAGYPWFLDWGRDTLICARGLIAGGWLDEVRQLLIVFGRFEEGGTLPNTIHGADASNRDTSDAPLWYGVVAEEFAAATSEAAFDLRVDDRRRLRDVLASIASGYLRGTANGIQVDPESALVWSPRHFTWMDTNYPAATPREGYPVEIQSLWIRLLRLLARLNAPAPDRTWGELADQATASLVGHYWLESRGWLADSLIARRGMPAARAVADQVLRSNCLIPISLGQVAADRARRCVAAAQQHLVLPGALRTLAPLAAEPPLPVHSPQGGLLNDPANPYWGRYEGDEDTRRKPAYHNGTGWTWTFPIFCEALVRAHDESPAAVAAARAYLGSMSGLLAAGCFGQLPEIVDGDAPHAQRGCDAQAWGATEALRVWRWLKGFPAG